MLRKFTEALVVLSLVGGPALGLLAGPAAAQVALSPFNAPDHRKTPEEIAKQKAIDNAYKAAMDKIPEKKSNDPWGGIRDTTPQASSPTATTTPAKTAKTKQPPQ